MQNQYSTSGAESQAKDLLHKAYKKKALNKSVISFLEKVGDHRRALAVKGCATHIGITNIGNKAKIVKADFCRERICNVCAWRRQSKFVAQMIPAIKELSKDYRFIFATLTVKNCTAEDLRKSIDNILLGYDRLIKRRQIKRAWVGKVRALELTYNPSQKTFHPHLHVLIAVKSSYFKSDDYITTDMLEGFWGECLEVNYLPICDIRAVGDEEKGILETLKYSFKPSEDIEALKGFYYALKGRRLVSFSGVFADIRRQFKQSDFEKILTDDIELPSGTHITYQLYKFDATGGVYTFFKEMEMVSK